MTSFITLMICDRRGLTPEWIERPRQQWINLPLELQAKFLVQQSILIAYLDLVYDNYPGCLFTAYRDSVLDMLKTFERSVNTGESDHLIGVAQKALSICQFMLRQTDALTFQLTDIDNFVQDNPDGVYVPTGVVSSFYTPVVHYLMTVAKYNQVASSKVKYVALDKLVVDNVTLPSFTVNADGTVDVMFDQHFTKYEFDPDTMTEYGAVTQKYGHDWLQFLACIDLSGYSFASITGFIASQAIELDGNVLQIGSISWLYLKLFQIVFGWVPHIKDRALVVPIASEEGCRVRLEQFMIHCRKHYGITFDDTKLLSLLTNEKTVMGQQLKTYFSATNPRGITTACYEVFKASSYGKFEELDINHAFKKGAVKSLEDLEASAEDGGQQGGTPASSPANGIEAEPSSDAPADNNTDDFGNFDQDMEGGMDDDPYGSSNQDSYAQGGSNYGALNDTQHTRPEDLDVPSTNSSKGITLEISPGDNLDTYLWRVEIRRHLDNILKNPPESLNTDSLTFIRKLKTYWLFILSVKTVSKLLKLKVPKYLKSIKEND